MPESEALYQDKYEVMAGHWPESYNECVLVLTSDGSISDYMLYAMGLRDYSELEVLLGGDSSGGSAAQSSYSYEDVLGTTYKVVCAADYYAYDSEYGVWVDKTENEAYLNQLVENGENLTIVGVVRPAEDSASALSTGINYPASLVTHMAQLAAESDAIQAQLAAPDVNIFTGEAFGKSGSSFSIGSLFSIDEAALTDLFDFDSVSFDTSTLNLDTDALMSSLSSADLAVDTDALLKYLSDFQVDAGDLDLSWMDSLSLNLSDLDVSEILDSTVASISAEAAAALLNDLLGGYLEYLESSRIAYSDLGEDFSAYLESDEAAEIVTKFLNGHSSIGDSSVSAEGLADAIASVLPEDEEITSADVEAVTTAVTAYINETADLSLSIGEDDLAQLTAALVSGYSVSSTSVSSTVDLDGLSGSLTEYLSSEAAAQTLSSSLAQVLDWEELQTQLTAAVGSYLEDALAAAVDAYMDSIEVQLLSFSEQMQSELTDVLTEEVSTQLSAAMEAVDGSLLTQISGQLSDSMESMMSGAIDELLTADQNALLSAFGFQMDADALSELLLSMSSAASTDYESNLAALGYVDFATPTEIDIYHTDFEAKDRVVALLDDCNSRMESSGETEKVIIYTDLVGTMMSSVTTIINVVTYVLIAFVTISLIVSCIMISIITQISVMECTKEIGILRAIGASKRNISQMFNAETFIIGISSGLLGVIISELLIIPINALIHVLADSTDINAVLPWSYAAILVVISIVITVLSGLLPARKAAKMNPVTALRSE